MNYLVSIIIPSFNRAHLLGQTLDSILEQSYENWECIVVDDGSKDYTQELMEFYCKKDSRIRFFTRPGELIKGANPCRNYGLEKSTGSYIQFFDSDDIMLPNNLELKLQKILECKCDFVVGKLINFTQEGKLVKQFYNREMSITLENFLFRKINWITSDPLISREILVKYKIVFNERMSSDQEYNFYAKLLSHTENGRYLNEVLVKRRLHSQSIQGKIDRSSPEYIKELFRNRYLTFYDLQGKIKQEILLAYLDQMMTIYYFAFVKKKIPKAHKLFNIVKEKKGLNKTVAYLFSLCTGFFFGKGYKLLQMAKGK